MKKFTFLLLLISISSTAQYTFEQLPTNIGSMGGNPGPFIHFNNDLYFSSIGPLSSGRELWKTDGTLAGLTQVADIYSGFGSSSPRNFFEFNGYLYFTATIFGDTGTELYRTDGTATELFKDFYPGTESGLQNQEGNQHFVVLNNKMYFFAQDDGNGFDLWRTDGSTTGTEKVADLNSYNLGLRDYFLEMNGELFFVMDELNENTIGSELYKYNELQHAVSVVKNISPSSNNSAHISFITKFDNKLFFSASNGIQKKLYVSDGTSEGTVIVENTIPLNYFNPLKMHVFNNELYFVANEINLGIDLYKCSKNVFGEYVVEIVYNFNASGSSNSYPFVNNYINTPSLFLELNNELYFFAKEETPPNYAEKFQIWKTDGTSNQIAFNIDASLVGNFSGRAKIMIVYNEKIYFIMDSVGMPEQLWVANPADNTLTRLTDYYGSEAQPQYLIEDYPIMKYKNSLFFSGKTNSEDYELWKFSDGTLSSSEFESDKKTSIYPNPSTGIVNIETGSTSEINLVLLDVLGKQINVFHNQKTIDISHLHSGIYFLKIKNLDTNIISTHKVIKQ